MECILRMAEFKPVKLKPLSETGSKTTYTVKSKNSEKLKGGKADNRPDTDFDPEQLKIGIKVESEHTKDRKIAKEVAKDHLSEIPDYYKRLKGMEDTAKKEISKSLGRANDLIKAMKESLKEEDMDLKKTKIEVEVEDDEDEEKEVKKGNEHLGSLLKALKASAIAGLSRRQRLDVAYRAGVAAGREKPSPFYTEPATLQTPGIGIDEAHVRPDYEPPTVPVRKVETPFTIPPKKCGDHTYSTAKAGPAESKPFWRR